MNDVDGLRGDLHAFSDPNSNSGYLVTAALLAERKSTPEEFFRHTIFTYGHRNVVRAVASGLAQSGSVDGYVWEVMASIEPDLTSRTRVIRRSSSSAFLQWPASAGRHRATRTFGVMPSGAALHGGRSRRDGRSWACCGWTVLPRSHRVSMIPSPPRCGWSEVSPDEERARLAGAGLWSLSRRFRSWLRC